MLADVLDLVDKQTAEKSVEIAGQWKTLVVGLVDNPTDRQFAPEAVVIQLQRLGKTAEDLRAAVELYKSRKAMVATIAAGEGSIEELSRLIQQSGEIEARWKEAERAHNDEVIENRIAQSRASRLRSDAEQARRDLLRTCSPEAHQRVLQVDAELGAVSRELENLRATASQYASTCDYYKRDDITAMQYSADGKTHPLPAMQERLSHAEAAIKAKEAEAKRLIEKRANVLATIAIDAMEF